MKKYTYDADENKIVLICEKESASPYLYFVLQTDDPDSSEIEMFEKIAYDVAEVLSKSKVVLYEARYRQLKYAKKKWFGRGWKPGKFNSKGATARLKQELVNSGWKDGIFADYYDFYDEKVLWSKTRRDSKCLCILQEKLDMDLFRKSDMTYQGEGTGGITITVYPSAQIRHLSNSQETIDAYKKTDDYILKFTADIIMPRSYITLNEKYMTAEELIEKIKPVIEKHKKVLEVNL